MSLAIHIMKCLITKKCLLFASECLPVVDHSMRLYACQWSQIPRTWLAFTLAHMSRDFRILVLGDSNAGKSSLINTFLKDVPLVPEASTSTDQHAANRCLPVVSAAALNGGTLYLVDSPCEDLK